MSTRLEQIQAGKERRRAAAERAQQLRVERQDRVRARRELLSTPLGLRSPDFSNVPGGGCSPRTQRCATARDHSIERRPCCVALNLELLRFVVDLLNKLEVVWWADYGTLLGAVRHGGFIPWDKDSDLGCLEAHKRTLLDLEPAVKRLGLGYHGRRSGTVKFMVSRKNTTNCDVFSWEADARGILHRQSYAGVDAFKGKQFPVEWLFPLTEVEFDGLVLKAPAAVRTPGKTPAPDVPGFEQGSLFLEHRYGPGWMHPLRANNDGVRR